VAAWDARSGAELFRRRVASHAAAIAVSPNSQLLAVGTEDGRLLRWNARTGNQQAPPIQVAGGGIAQISFSPGGRMFAVSSLDQTASLWDLRSRKRLGNPLPTAPGEVPVVLFERNGRLLVPELANATEWPTDVRTWERFGCGVAGRDLTPGEWNDLLPNRTYRSVCRP
jgi:WD40 repeat protein